VSPALPCEDGGEISEGGGQKHGVAMQIWKTMLEITKGGFLKTIFPWIHTYRVAKTHRMPSVAGHFCKRATNLGLFCGE